MKISIWWMLLAATVGIAATIIYFKYFYTPDATVISNPRPKYDVITFTLPNSKDAAIFGPAYWKANEFLDQNIPCSICREKAIPLGSFKHDIVNLMNDKDVFDKNNWKLWVKKINELDKKVPA